VLNDFQFGVANETSGADIGVFGTPSRPGLSSHLGRGFSRDSLLPSSTG
jgi:hypothetical protein